MSLHNEFPSTLHINEFGPLHQVDIAIPDILVLNGAQTSGKSTLAKCLHYFKSLPQTLLLLLLEAAREKRRLSDRDVVVACRRRLMHFFGTTKHFSDFRLRYAYDRDVWIEITRESSSGHARVVLSPSVKNGLLDASDLLQMKAGTSGFLDYQAEWNERRVAAQEALQGLFRESRTPVFIPAGRSLVATLSGELRRLDPSNLDTLTKEFIERIHFHRPEYAHSLQELVEDRKRLSSSLIDVDQAQKAIHLIEMILHGSYRFENGEERIVYDAVQGRYVKFEFASSGQQEVLWILLLVFQLIIGDRPTCCVIEEPEAHLFPDTQYDLVRLLALFASSPDHQLVITTHSPYVLAAMNLSLLAWQVPSQHEFSGLSPARVQACFLRDGKLDDILDEETGLIDPAYLDQVSGPINEAFDRLLQARDQK